MSFKNRFRQRRKRHEFDPEKLGCKCSECPYKSHPKAEPFSFKPQSKGPKSPALVIVNDWPMESDIAAGRVKENSTSRFVEVAFHAAGNHNTLQIPALLCRPPKAADSGVKQALACCRPRVEASIRAAGASWVLAAGPSAFVSVTAQEGDSEPWLGSPMPARFEGIQVIPTYIPWLVRQKAGSRFTGQFIAHIDRIARLADGRLKEFVWPEIIIDNCESGLRRILQSVLSGSRIGVDLETRSDMSISCIGLAIDNLAVCVQQPMSAIETELVEQILLAAHIETQNGPAFDHRVLRRRIKVLPPGWPTKWDDTLLRAAILVPQLKKNLGALVSNEFHASAHKAQFKTDEETGRMTGDWDSRDPEVEYSRRIYCAKDAWTTLMLAYRQDEQLEEYV